MPAPAPVSEERIIQLRAQLSRPPTLFACLITMALPDFQTIYLTNSCAFCRHRQRSSMAWIYQDQFASAHARLVKAIGKDDFTLFCAVKQRSAFNDAFRAVGNTARDLTANPQIIALSNRRQD